MLAEAAVDLAFEMRWTAETVLDMTVPQIAMYQKAHWKKIEAKRRAMERANRHTAGNVRTSLEAYAARRAAEAAEAEDE